MIPEAAAPISTKQKKTKNHFEITFKKIALKSEHPVPELWDHRQTH